MSRCVLWLMALVGGVAIFVSVLSYVERSNWAKPDQGTPVEDVKRCKENLVAIAANIEQFYCEMLRFPDGLEDLSHSYVFDGKLAHRPIAIPVCPAARRATYFLEYDSTDQQRPDAPYTLSCSGGNHAGLPHGFPLLRQPPEWPEWTGATRRRHFRLYPP